MAGRTIKAATLKTRATTKRAAKSGEPGPAIGKAATKPPPATKGGLAHPASAKRPPVGKRHATRQSARTLAIRAPSARELLALRDAELELVSAIQRGIVTKLGFREIVDIVGDKLRELFRTPDLGISWFDERANLVHMLYAYEHGRRIVVPPSVPKPGGLYETMRKTHLPIVIASVADHPKIGLITAPGTDMSRSMMAAPIFVGDRLLGDISIENYERENAFGPQDARLLTSVATSLGVALQSAHLFDETQRLFSESEQRAAELAVINSIQQGVAAELDFQKIVELVGDKLREVLKTDEIGIRWIDHDRKIVRYLYEFEHGVRLSVPDQAPTADAGGGLVAR
jgi:hypothetical protein